MGKPKSLSGRASSGQELPELPSFRLPLAATTFQGFRAWARSPDAPERLRASFLDHEIFIDLDREELQAHVVVRGEVARALLNLEREQEIGRFFGRGLLFSNEAAGLSTEPDGTFVTLESFRSGRVRKVCRDGCPGEFVEIAGTPDCVLEIVSDSSVTRDTVLLRAAYHRAGIPEYWLIDARGEVIDLQILLREEGGYAESAPIGGWLTSRVFGRTFRLERESDDFGLWEYTLQVR